MERFIAQKIITGGFRLEVRGPTGPSCTRHPLKGLNQPGRGGGGSRESLKRQAGEGDWKTGSLRSSLGSIFLRHSLPEGLLWKCHRCAQVPLYFEWQVTGRERTRSHLLSRAARASLLTVSLRQLARRLDSIRQEQLLFSLNPDFLWSKDVLI